MTREGKNNSRWRHLLPPLPGVGAAFLPVGACPACWPVYSGVLGAIGLTFLLNATYLLWITAALMGLALSALAYRARARRRYGPLALGATCIALILFFKFAYPLDVLVYAGLFGLVAATVSNAWPKKTASTVPCPHCSEAETAGNRTNTQ